MTELILPWAALAFALALALNAYRLARGPTPADRVLALDTLYMNSIALLVLFGIRHDTQAYFEAALVVALLGFVSTIALAKYLARVEVIE
jgi:multicomponent K+:H+ antiporter subunit F